MIDDVLKSTNVPDGAENAHKDSVDNARPVDNNELEMKSPTEKNDISVEDSGGTETPIVDTRENFDDEMVDGIGADGYEGFDIESDALEVVEGQETIFEDNGSDYVYTPPKSVAESIQEEDYLRFGVDPKKDRKAPKQKKPSIFKMMNPRYLKPSVEKYGFSFSAKRFYLFVLAAFFAAIGVGFMFQLDWYFIAMIAVVAACCVPSVFLCSLRGMYHSRQFHDVSDYIETLLYSFRRKKKILTSLEDAYSAFEDDDGVMKDLIAQAINHIKTGETEGDIHREALDIIEREYSNDRLRSVHNFLIAVETNGGKVETSVDMLLDERAMWDERVHVFQTEKNTVRRNVIVSIVFSLALCFGILYILSIETLAQLQIPKNLLVQITSTGVIIANLLLFVKVVNRFTQSWLLQEKKQSDYQALRDYFYVQNYDPVKDKRSTIIWTCCTSLIWIAGLLMNQMLLVIAGALISLFCMFSSTISYSMAKRSTTKEIQKAFPQWMMELALILQTDNVQVAISKTLNSAPAVLRPELEMLVERFEEAPHSQKPYTEFLKKYDFSDIRSAMKMLYSVSASGTGNIDEQIADLIRKQNSLMDKAEKINNSDQLAGMTSINMVPMFFCIIKSVVDMTILVFSMFQLMSI